MSETEIWIKSPTLPAYEVSSFGRLRCIPREGRMPHGGFRVYGGGPPILGVWVKSEGRYILPYQGKTYKVAPLICEAFNGPRPDGHVCMHLDENSRNNRPDNLAWGTQKQNLNAPGFVRHCRESRLRAWNGNVLPDSAIREIRSRSNEVRAALAREFGVSAAHISNIIAGRARPNA